MKTILWVLCCWMSVWSCAIAQTTCLEGKVTEMATGEGVIFGSVGLYQEGVLVVGTETDFDGHYSICNLRVGSYDVEVSYVGLPTERVEGVQIVEGKTVRLDIEMKEGEKLEVITVMAYKVPLVEQDNSTQGATVTSEQIRGLPKRNINALAAHTAGISVSDEVDAVTIRGSRDHATHFYVDGIRVSDQAVQYYQQLQQDRQLGKREIRRLLRQQRREQGDEFNPMVENPYRSPIEESFSTFSIDVDRASYSYLRASLTQGHGLPTASATRTEELVNYFSYDYPQPDTQHPFSVTTELGECPWQADKHLLLIGLQGENRNLAELPPSNLVFLVDVSGSMGESNKLPLVKQALEVLINQLRPQDFVSIVVYAGSAGLVLPPTSGRDKKAIRAAIDQLKSGGSTAGGAGIELAYATAEQYFIEAGNNRVILATDGDFNVGISDPEALEALVEEKRESGVFLTTLGFGMGNLKDNRLETLADKGNGQYAYIDNLQEAQKVFSTELTGSLYTIAKDVKLQLQFNPNVVANYRLIGYENRLLAKEDFDDDTKDAGELGAGHSVTALYEVELLGEAMAEDLATLDLRYKQPDGEQSYLMQEPVTHQCRSTVETSDNFRWAAAVTAFSLLVRDSAFQGDASYDLVRALAAGAKGEDPFGFRAGFLDLIDLAEQQSKPNAGVTVR